MYQSIGTAQSGDKPSKQKRNEGRYQAKFRFQLRGLINKQRKSDWRTHNGWIEMQNEYSNLQNDFYVRARGKTSVPFKKWFYTNPIFVKVRK